MVTTIIIIAYNLVCSSLDKTCLFIFIIPHMFSEVYVFRNLPLSHFLLITLCYIFLYFVRKSEGKKYLSLQFQNKTRNILMKCSVKKY
jgi:hypothetical protein